jgi:hypothetical protein
VHVTLDVVAEEDDARPAAATPYGDGESKPRLDALANVVGTRRAHTRVVRQTRVHASVANITASRCVAFGVKFGVVELG